MRSIDADALKDRIDKCVTLSGVGLEPLMAVRDIKALISVMPTIDAIPMDWLEKHDSENISDSNGNVYGRRYITLSEALSIWQKEQEV